MAKIFEMFLGKDRIERMDNHDQFLISCIEHGMQNTHSDVISTGIQYDASPERIVIGYLIPKTITREEAHAIYNRVFGMAIAGSSKQYEIVHTNTMIGREYKLGKTTLRTQVMIGELR